MCKTVRPLPNIRAFLFLNNLPPLDDAHFLERKVLWLFTIQKPDRLCHRTSGPVFDRAEAFVGKGETKGREMREELEPFHANTEDLDRRERKRKREKEK